MIHVCHYRIIRMVNQVWLFTHLMLVLALPGKKTAGNSYTTPNHGCIKFADQDEVDNFVDNYSKSKKIEGEVQPRSVMYIVVHGYVHTLIVDCNYHM